MFLFCCCMCFAEHPEDKQLPVHPAAGHPSSVCYHPQFTPPGSGILRHAHHLQPCWWVWPRSLPFKAKNSLLGHVTVCATRRCFLLSVFSVISIFGAEMWALTVCGRVLFWQSSPWAARRSLPYRASALLGSHWVPCRHGNSISLARQLLILWCE